MRTTTVLTTQVTYPDSTVFVGDNIPISFSDSIYPTGAEVSVTNMATMKTVDLVYISELKNLTLDLTDTVRRLHQVGGCSMNVKVKVYSDKFYSGTFSFNIYTLDGKSLVHRQHGSTRTVYLYDPEDLTKVNLFFIGSGSFSAGGSSYPIIYSGRNSLNFSSWITSEGEYTGCYCYKCKGGAETKRQGLRLRMSLLRQTARLPRFNSTMLTTNHRNPMSRAALFGLTAV